VKTGETIASPPASSRTARTSSAGRASLARTPLAPARRAARRCSSSSDSVKSITATPEPLRAAGSFDAPKIRVEQHDVCEGAAGEGHGLIAVARLARDGDPARFEKHAEARPHERPPVGDHNSNGGRGCAVPRLTAAPEVVEDDDFAFAGLLDLLVGVQREHAVMIEV
jgi:hypothetical protein